MLPAFFCWIEWRDYMKKKGFATSAILYTMLLLFLVLLVGILNNLQNKKTILDQLKADTISALESDSKTDYLLGVIEDLNSRMTQLENNYYTKEEVDKLLLAPLGSYQIFVTFGDLQAGMYAYSQTLAIGDMTSRKVEVQAARVEGIFNLTAAEVQIVQNSIVKNRIGLGFHLVNANNASIIDLAKKIAGKTLVMTIDIKEQ